MICYKDRTHCNAYMECKHGKNCELANTPELQAEAKAFGLPVAEVSKRGCFEPKEVGDES